MKLRLVRALQIYLLNPPVKLLFGRGVVPPGYPLLETVGRPVGCLGGMKCGLAGQLLGNATSERGGRADG